jgi:uncharacterized protein with HEPN domain
MSSEQAVEHFRDIVENIRLIGDYIGNMGRAEFDADLRTRDAVERCLMRLSEAATRLGTAADRICPDPPWRDIRGLGNHLRHAYDRIDTDEIWNIVRRDLPVLDRACRSALDRLQSKR